VSFYDFAVDEEGKLVYIFWADATSRKNYTHFGEIWFLLIPHIAQTSII
jgi:sensor domain CHASE-containing protein